ncbi:MAG: hypothetical protein ACJ76N_08925, partial [Thermoanaerobaculia bacterium]
TDTPGEMPVATPWGRWLSRHSLLYMKLGTLSKVARLKRANRRAAANPRGMEARVAGALAEPDPAIRRVWEVNFPFAKPEVILGGYARFNAAARRVAGCAASAIYLPTAGFGLRGTSLYAPYDPIHFNDQGADRMGRKMAEAFITRGLLERRPAGSARCEAFRSGS